MLATVNKSSPDAVRGTLVFCRDDPFLTDRQTAFVHEPDGLVICRDGLIEAVGSYDALRSRLPSNADIADRFNVYGYSAAQTLVQVLRQCGDDLTRENVMREAANLHDLQLPMMLPGIVINTSATNFRPIRQMELQRFDGERWVLFGGVVGG